MISEGEINAINWFFKDNFKIIKNNNKIKQLENKIDKITKKFTKSYIVSLIAIWKIYSIWI